MSTKPQLEFDPKPNPHALRPVTGQPDFATITFKYVPGPYSSELKYEQGK